jgi:hypothetical protein
LAGGKLAGWGARYRLRPGGSCGVVAAMSSDAGFSEAPNGVADGGEVAVKPGRLFFLKDTVSQSKFLVDTGSSYGILPHRSKKPPHSPVLRAADGRRIKCWGSKAAEVELGGVSYSWRLIQADVKFPILGIDFMRHFQLVIDVVGSQLLHRARVAAAVQAAGQTGQVSSVVVASSPSSSPPSASPPSASPPSSSPPSSSTPSASPPSASPPSASTPSSSSPLPAPKPPPAVLPLGGTDFADILAEFPGVQRPAVGVGPPQHGVEHHIITKGPPATAKFRRLDPMRLAAAKAEFQQMLDSGVVRRSSSSWAAWTGAKSSRSWICRRDIFKFQ